MNVAFTGVFFLGVVSLISVGIISLGRTLIALFKQLRQALILNKPLFDVFYLAECVFHCGQN